MKKLTLFLAILCTILSVTVIYTTFFGRRGGDAVAVQRPLSPEEQRALARAQDLRFIVEKTFLTPEVEPFLNLLAIEGIKKSQKQIDPITLMVKFRESLKNEKTVAKFFEPYQEVFSDEEIHELRTLYERPVWEKYSKEGVHIFQANVQTLKDLFKELASTYGMIKKTKIVVEEEPEETVSVDQIIQITQENYEAELEWSTKPLIIDVNAAWCNPCRRMEPIIDELSGAYQDTIQFGKIDFDSQKELAKKYGVTSLPTILFIKRGETTPVMKHVGFLSKKDFQAKIAEFLKK